MAEVSVGRTPRTVVVLQPMFFPWVGHLEQVRLADVFVHYDDVQYCPRKLMNRVKVKTRHGSEWLTVPVRRPGRSPIAAVSLHYGTEWRGRHLRTLEHALARAPFRDDALALVSGVYAREHASLADLCIATIEALAGYFGIRAEFVRSSSLGITGRSTTRLVDICRRLQATRYVTGHGARNYLRHEEFEAAGIAVEYMDYRRSPYPQLHGAFDPHVSALDLVANRGREGRAVIDSGTVGWREFVLGACAV